MVIYKDYTNEQYNKFLSNKFNNNFGLSEEKIIDWYFGQAGAQSCIASYGVTKSNLKSKYIPILKNKLDGGYFMFLAISVQEGGGAGNWINHYGNDTSSDPAKCMEDDCNYINSLLKSKNYPPALSAPEVNGGGLIPEDSSGSTRAMLNGLPLGTVGRYYMPATLAGNAWVFCTKWCESHQGPAPGAYFGNPYDAIIKVIKSAGADPFSGESSNPDPDPDPTPPTPDKPSMITDPVEVFKRALKVLLYKNVYYTNNPNYYKNAYLKLTKELNNLYHISLNLDLDKMSLSDINKLFGGGGETPPPDPDPTPDKGGYYWPFNGNNKIIVTSPYGYRDASIGSGAFHQGIDIVDAGGSATPIYAIHSGTVTISSDAVPGWESAGSMILIKNDTDGKIITYEEFKPGSMLVKVGDKVKGGQHIATNGISGNATGEHLHLGINTKGLAPLNPSNWENPAPFFGIKNATGTYTRPDNIGNSGN